MGGSFSAQAADLHSLWSVYIHRGLFRRLGTLRVTDSGFPYWENSHGRVSMQQFRDNILVASSYPDSPGATDSDNLQYFTPMLGIACSL